MVDGKEDLTMRSNWPPVRVFPDHAWQQGLQSNLPAYKDMLRCSLKLVTQVWPARSNACFLRSSAWIATDNIEVVAPGIIETSSSNSLTEHLPSRSDKRDSKSVLRPAWGLSDDSEFIGVMTRPG